STHRLATLQRASPIQSGAGGRHTCLGEGINPGDEDERAPGRYRCGAAMSEEVRLDGIEPLLVCAIRASGTEMFQYLVLGLLRDGKPRHGYALMKDYRDRSGVQLSTGSFYRELQKLAAKGLVRTSANP